MSNTNDPSPQNDIVLLSRGSKTYGRIGSITPVFREFSLTVRAGSRLCLMGPNACGKSTLLHILLGLEELDEGKLKYEADATDRAAAVIQDYRTQLLTWASVRTNVLFPLRANSGHALSPELAIDQSLQFLRLLGHDFSLSQRVSTLSGGQQQALVLARASLFSPRLWLIDEGFGAVDLTRRSRVCDLLVERSDKGRSVLFVTHDLDDALRFGTELMIVDSGMRELARMPIPRRVDEDTASFLTSRRSVDFRQRVQSVLTEGNKDRTSRP